MEMLYKLVLISFGVSAISFTISVTSIFEWLRELISPLHHKLEELIHCPFCLSFYFSVIIIIISKVYMVICSITIVNILFTAFIIMGMSGIIHYVLLRAYKPITEQMIMKRMNELNK